MRRNCNINLSIQLDKINRLIWQPIYNEIKPCLQEGKGRSGQGRPDVVDASHLRDRGDNAHTDGVDQECVDLVG